MTDFKCLIRSFKRRHFTNAQRRQEHTLTHAAVSAHFATDEPTEQAFWAGVNYAMNDLWQMTCGYPPVFLKPFWTQVEQAITENERNEQ